MTLLALSPHLDDALLSCAGHLERAARAGERVVVATAFSECADGALRRGEDARAAARLGVEVEHWGFADAPLRGGFEASYPSLVLGAPPEPALLAALRAAAAAAVARLGPRAVLLPLAVGGHVDHRAVFRLHLDLRAAVWFYVDEPYARVPGAFALRIAELGAAVAGSVPPDLSAEPEQDAFAAAFRCLPHLRSYAPADGSARAAAAAQHFRLRRAEERCTGLALERVGGGAELPADSRAPAAVREYASQWVALFGSGLPPSAAVARMGTLFRRRVLTSP